MNSIIINNVCEIRIYVDDNGKIPNSEALQLRNFIDKNIKPEVLAKPPQKEG